MYIELSANIANYGQTGHDFERPVRIVLYREQRFPLQQLCNASCRRESYADPRPCIEMNGRSIRQRYDAMFADGRLIEIESG